MKKLFTFACLIIAVATSQAQIQSTFDGGLDGWTFLNAATSLTPSHSNANGNPGGFASITYSSNTNTTVQNWIAPSKFHGSHVVRSLGMQFKFDLQQSQAGTASGFEVVIRNGGTYMYQSGVTPKPAVAPEWTSYSYTLDETGGWLYPGGVVATRGQVKAVLSNVTSIEIRGTYATNAAYTSGLDNVVLEQRTLVPCPSVTSFSPTSGLPGSSVVIAGDHFDPAPENNAVYFGGVLSTVIASSTTQLTVTVPQGAALDKITVINKTTGLARQSTHPFIPVFDGGGRIIPASFKTRTDIMLVAEPRGFSLADVDGDGWNDIIVAMQNNTVSIFRNAGAGGDISTSAFSLVATLAGAGNAGALSTTDIDGDGKLDIVTGYNSASLNNFATFRNVSSPGNISFEDVTLWPGLVYSGRFADIADVDGDGRPDLIGQHANGSVNVDFWIAQNISYPGRIEFSTSRSFFGGSTLDAGSGVSVGDLNNDGRVEVLVKYNFGNTFAILPNTSGPGDISFGTPIPFSNGASGDINVQDFNNDGQLDLAWKQGSGNIYIRINSNAGGPLAADDFATTVILGSSLINYGAMAVGDINGDGKPDVIATDSNNMGTFENVYSGGTFSQDAFISAYLHPGAGNSTYPSKVSATDLNGDGKPDVVMQITNSTPQRIAIFENQNMRAPVISASTVSPLSGEVGSQVKITGNHFSTSAQENNVWFGAVAATVLSSSEEEITAVVPPGASYDRVSVTRGELTSFYHLPFNVTFSSGSSFDAGSFLPPVAYPLTGADYDVQVADMNNDGKPDIVAESRIVTGIIRNYGLAYKNVHTNGEITASSFVLDDTTSTSAQNLKLTDIDGDGLRDIVSLQGAYRNTSTADELSHDPVIGIASTNNHAWADFNRDGKTDLITTSGANVAIFENRSRAGKVFEIGTFATMSSAITLTKPATDGAAAAADFDGDGWPEFAATNPGTDNLRIWRNTGSNRISSAQFALVGDIATGDNPGRLYTGDLDVDGKMDLMLYHGTGTNSTMITVLHNQSTNGEISFTRVDFTIPAAATIAHIDDLDGDGRPEIIVTSETSDQFFILKNVSSPGVITTSSFATPIATAVTNPRGLATGDLNLDGKPEIIIASAPNTLLVFENAIPTGPSINIVTQPISGNACVGESIVVAAAAEGPDNITYRWQKLDGATFTDLAEGNGYSGTATANLAIATNVTGPGGSGEYRVRISGDNAADVYSNEATIAINARPSAPMGLQGVSCGPGSVTLAASGTETGEFHWYDTPSGDSPVGTGETFTTPNLNATTDFYVSFVDPSCESDRTVVSALIVEIAKPIITANGSANPVDESITLCPESTLTLSAPPGFSKYLWSDGRTSPSIDITVGDHYSVTLTDSNDCSSAPSDEVEVIVLSTPCNNQPPVISPTIAAVIIEGIVAIDLAPLVSDPDDNLDISTLHLPVSQSQQGASASINVSNQLTLQYPGVMFVGTDMIAIEVCDLFGACVQQDLVIVVSGDVVVYNALSPNGDGKNDFFEVKYIDLLPDARDNRVTILNRWGDIVFEVADYNNVDRVFSGRSNSGKDLPTGIYFYKIEFAHARKTVTGFLSLKR